MSRKFPLSTITTVRTGGLADEVVKIKKQSDLNTVASFLKNKECFVVGGGSNIIFSDEVFNGCILKNELEGLDINDSIVTAQSGTLLQDLVDFTIEKGLGGLHKLTGIPGTVGGAVHGNAGAYGQTISDLIDSVKVLRDGNILELSKAECDFDYRHSKFKNTNDFILETKFHFFSIDKKVLKDEADEVYKQRLVNYPTGLKCPGSFFMNVKVNEVSEYSLSLVPEDKIKNGRIFVGWLLETVGAKGYRIGGIEVADYHSNLFINKYRGNSSDFYLLAKELAHRVKEKFGIIIKPEVQLVGFPPF